jgi:hypothetical protein
MNSQFIKQEVILLDVPDDVPGLNHMIGQLSSHHQGAALLLPL